MSCLVKIFWNTHPDGSLVDTETVDWDAKDAPVSLYGPFEDESAAESWMINDYPDGDMDVYDMDIIDRKDVPKDWYVNKPESIFGDIPDEDIRDDSQEIHSV